MKKKLSLVALSVLVLSLVMPVTTAFGAALPSADTFTSSATIPFDVYVFISCAMSGVGEEVHLTGNLHVLDHFTANANGGFMVTSHYQPEGVMGVGSSSGDKYQATGVTSDRFNVNGLPYTGTYVNNFRIIGQGNGNNYLVHENFHVTVNANGEMTAYVDNFSVECK